MRTISRVAIVTALSAALLTQLWADDLGKAETFARSAFERAVESLSLLSVDCPPRIKVQAVTSLCAADSSRDYHRFKEVWDRVAAKFVGPLTEFMKPEAIVVVYDWKAGSREFTKSYAVGTEAGVVVLYGLNEQRGLLIVTVSLVPSD